MSILLGVDGTTQVNAALINQFLAVGEGSKLGVHLVYGRLRYNGASWEVHSTTDSAVLVSGNLAFSVNHLNVTLANFNLAMPPLVCPTFLAGGIYLPSVIGASASQAQIGFWDSTFTLITTPDSKMDCSFYALGA